MIREKIWHPLERWKELQMWLSNDYGRVQQIPVTQVTVIHRQLHVVCIRVIRVSKCLLKKDLSLFQFCWSLTRANWKRISAKEPESFWHILALLLCIVLHRRPNVPGTTNQQERQKRCRHYVMHGVSPWLVGDAYGARLMRYANANLHLVYAAHNKQSQTIVAVARCKSACVRASVSTRLDSTRPLIFWRNVGGNVWRLMIESLASLARSS